MERRQAKGRKADGSGHAQLEHVLNGVHEVRAGGDEGVELARLLALRLDVNTRHRAALETEQPRILIHPGY